MSELQRKIDYSINLLRKAEGMALRLDPENGFSLYLSNLDLRLLRWDGKGKSEGAN